MTPFQLFLNAPSRWLFLAFAYALVAAACAIGIALQAPWLGLRLAAVGDMVQVQHSQGPSSAVPARAVLHSIGPGTHASLPSVALRASDLIEEPDVLPEYAQLDSFYARQTHIAALLAEPAVTLHWSLDGAHGEALVEPHSRPISALPVLFWFQLVVSVTGCLIACWVWVLKPGDWGVRMFGLTGLLFPVFAMPAAVYSGRELALPGGDFFVLSSLNHWGSMMFGAALCAIFMSHPRPLVRPVHLVWPFAVFNLWWLTDTLRIAPSPAIGVQVPVMLEMLLAIGLAGVQWRRSKGDPIGRATLRWFSVSLLLGSGLFILLVIATASIGWLPPIPQGYAFGFFLFIYIGIALGLRRYRLFELDEWALKMLPWVGGALAVVAVDALLVLVLDWSAGPALGVSLWVCGALYFPLRQWLWQRFAQRPGIQLPELMPDVVRIAFQPSRSAQAMLWKNLLRRIHDPLHLEENMAYTGTRACITEGGLNLQIPACGTINAHTLRYPARGQRLFSRKDASFIDSLLHLLDEAESSRDAHDRGVRDERRRIARDMHDDVGARLLMLMHRSPSPELAELARAAMHDLRTALNVLDAHAVPLADALADWRAEAGARCDAAKVQLHWVAPTEPAGELPPRPKAILERALREGLSNALRHAQPQQVEITVVQDAEWLELSVRNDGPPTDPAQWAQGRGLRGMRQRLEEYGAQLGVKALRDGRTELALRISLASAHPAERLETP